MCMIFVENVERISICLCVYRINHIKNLVIICSDGVCVTYIVDGLVLDLATGIASEAVNDVAVLLIANASPANINNVVVIVVAGSYLLIRGLVS